MRMGWKSGVVLMAVLLIKSSAIVNASENEEAQVPENTGAIEQESYLDSGRIDVMEEDTICQEGWNGTMRKITVAMLILREIN